jgi:esterase/lipase superfamily enzyme
MPTTTHYLITNRQVRVGNGGKGYLRVNEKECIRTDGQEEAMDNLRYGQVSFDSKRAKKLADFDLKLYPDLTDDQMERLALEEKLPQGAVAPSLQVFEALRTAGMGARKNTAHVLVYVHGFNSDLEGALTTLADLHRQYVEPANSPIGQIVMFTWPSRGSLTRYRDDARDAQKSGYAMARAFRSMSAFFKQLILDAKRKGEDPGDAFCPQKIHLLCHSMGNRVFEGMMTELRANGIRPNSVFGEILLMAADVDDDCMEREKAMSEAILLAERLHVYYHNGDQALGISERTKNAYNRLGRWGARRTNPLPDSVYQADVSAITDETGIREKVAHHWYYLNSPSVVKDVMAVVKGSVTKYKY